MAHNNPPKKPLTVIEAVDITRGSEDREQATVEEDNEEEVGEEELKKLEMEAEEMAKKILEFRATLPDQLRTTLTSILSSQRPNFPNFDSVLDPRLARESTADLGEVGTSNESALPAVRDQNNAEKLHMLKDRISSNIAAMPIVINRVNDCISKIDNLDIYNGVMHPAFRKKKPS